MAQDNILKGDQTVFPEISLNRLELNHLLKTISDAGHENCGYCSAVERYVKIRLHILGKKQNGHPKSSARKEVVEECQQQAEL